MMNHQKLRCYQMALQLLKEVASVMTSWPSARAVLKDQLERASTSVILNLAEGAGKLTPKDRRKFFSIARGSIQEVAACLDIAYALGSIESVEYARHQATCLSIVKMVSRLIEVQLCSQS